MDPFFFQLIVVPSLVVIIGIVVTLKFKKIYVAPLLVLFLNASYEIISPYSSGLSSWNIILPLVALFVSIGTFIIDQNRV